MKNFQSGCHVIECDSCNETIESERSEQWETFWPGAKRNGWKSKRIGAEWVHACPKHEV